ncbi:MAG: hypothetical protein ACR2PT_00375 [Endozoicomonas sp.]
MTGKVPPSGQNPVQVPQHTEEQEALEKPSQTSHPNLGKVSLPKEPKALPETRGSTTDDRPGTKPIIKRKTEARSPAQPLVLTRERKSQRSKGVSFDEKPDQVIEHNSRDTEKLRSEIQANMLFLSGKDAELVDMLSAQYILDLTTRMNSKKRQETFESLTDAVRERLPEEHHERFNELVTQAENIAGAHLSSTIDVLSQSTPELLESAIADKQEALARLYAKKPVDQKKAAKLEARLDEFQVALEVLNKQVGRKSIAKLPDKVFSQAKAPKLWVLRILLSENLTDEARHLIKTQRVPETVEAMAGILEFGGYDQPELLDIARQQLAKLYGKPDSAG